MAKQPKAPKVTQAPAPIGKTPLQKIHHKRGVSRQAGRANDFAAMKEAGEKGLLKGPQSERDRAMMAAGRTQIHAQQTADFKYRASQGGYLSAVIDASADIYN